MPTINLKNIEAVCRGDESRKLKYLLQFKELIPERCTQLKVALENNNRLIIRQILHKMSPQLQFFGIQDVAIPISRLECEFEVMEYHEIHDMVINIICKLDAALKEVNQLLNH